MSTLVGVSYALSGLVHVTQAKWVFAARWPRMKNLALGHAGVATTDTLVTGTFAAALFAWT